MIALNQLPIVRGGPERINLKPRGSLLSTRFNPSMWWPSPLLAQLGGRLTFSRVHSQLSQVALPVPQYHRSWRDVDDAGATDFIARTDDATVDNCQFTVGRIEDPAEERVEWKRCLQRSCRSRTKTCGLLPYRRRRFARRCCGPAHGGRRRYRLGHLVDNRRPRARIHGGLRRVSTRRGRGFVSRPRARGRVLPSTLNAPADDQQGRHGGQNRRGRQQLPGGPEVAPEEQVHRRR
jgi:hypothetical protein